MYSEELQIEIDDVYACGGTCPGCVLADKERRTQLPDMSAKAFDIAIRKVGEYIGTLDNLNKVNLTYGIGDHFRMSDKYIDNIVSKGISLIRDTGFSGTYSSLFVSTSLIGNGDSIKSKLDILSKHSNVEEIPVIPLVVFDPVKLYKERYWNKYIDTIIYAREKFERIDLAINISDDVVSCLKPEWLFDFSKKHDFQDVTINWVPSINNIENTTNNVNAISDWLIKFGRLAVNGGIETSYNPVIERLVRNFSGNNVDFRSALYETVSKSIQIDHLGNLFPKFEAIGDVPYNEMTGFNVYGNIVGTDSSIKDLIESNIVRTATSVLGNHLNHKSCASCEFLNPCSLGGFHIYNKAISSCKKEDGNHCPNVAKELFKDLLNR